MLKTAWYGVLALLVVTLVTAQTVPNSVIQHVIAREGDRTTGYIPRPRSGVTIGYGVDLGQQTADSLKKAGVSQEIIDKVEPYLGYTTKAAVKAAGLTPSNLKLTKTEAEAISIPIIQESYSKVQPLTKNMDAKGVAALTSIRHWNNYLACPSCEKLTTGTRTNHLWPAIKSGTATTAQLKVALEKTLKGHNKGSAHYNRIQAEIDDLNSSCDMKRSAGVCNVQDTSHDSTQTSSQDSTQTSSQGSTQTSSQDSTPTSSQGSTQTSSQDSTPTSSQGSTQTSSQGSTQTSSQDSTHLYSSSQDSSLPASSTSQTSQGSSVDSSNGTSDGTDASSSTQVDSVSGDDESSSQDDGDSDDDDSDGGDDGDDDDGGTDGDGDDGDDDQGSY